MKLITSTHLVTPTGPEIPPTPLRVLVWRRVRRVFRRYRCFDPWWRNLSWKAITTMDRLHRYQDARNKASARRQLVAENRWFDLIARQRAAREAREAALKPLTRHHR